MAKRKTKSKPTWGYFRVGSKKSQVKNVDTTFTTLTKDLGYTTVRIGLHVAPQQVVISVYDRSNNMVLHDVITPKELLKLYKIK